MLPSRLNEEYGTVSKSLENKLKRFEGAKEKDEIQGRANRLASNVQEKLTELSGKNCIKIDAS